MHSKSIRILLIEDDPEQASFVADFLTKSRPESNHFELEAKEALADGLQTLKKNGAFDIILLDLNLPDSQGIETFVQVASQAGRIPIIPLTGSGDERLALEAMSLGAQDYMVKGSFSGAMLKRAILYAIERKRLLGQLEDLITKNADGMVVIDSGGWVRQVNAAAETIFGIKADLLVGKPFDFPVFPNQIMELKFPLTDGQEKIAEMRTSEIEWDGKPACLASIRDITEIRRIEQLKAEVKEHHRLDKLKDDFVASISSELRAPLTVLHGAIHNLLSGAQGILNEAQIKTVEMARKGTEHLMKAINNILDISLLESGKVELHRGPVKVGTLLQKAIEGLSPIAKERGICIEIDAPSDLPEIDADQDLISRVISQLLDNAVRYARKKILVRAQSIDGALPAGAGNIKRSSGLGITLVSARRGIQLSVIDDGVGIPKNKLGMLFKKFAHLHHITPNGSQGTGLGLAICKKIVQIHHGRIWVESVEASLDQGTQFHFVVPQYQQGSQTLSHK